MSLTIPYSLSGFKSHLQSKLAAAECDLAQAKRERLPWLTAHAIPVYYWKRLANVFSKESTTDDESDDESDEEDDVEFVRKEVVFQDCTKTVSDNSPIII